MKKTICCLLLSIFLLNACTIIQEYHFNKDFSGHAKLSIDMGTFLQMMAGMDSSGASVESMKDSLDFVFTESAEKLKNLNLKNIKYGWEGESNILFMSYDFDNIQILNRALNESNAQNAAIDKSVGGAPHEFFSRKGKTLIYKGIKSDKDSISDMQSMEEYYQYSLVFTFERKIKKAINPNISIDPDAKKVELKGNMFTIIRPGYDSDITFKLK
jgi:hypothetical protein